MTKVSIIFILFFCYFAATTTSIKLKLIHHQSTNSPFYDPSLNHAELALENSFKRLSFICARVSSAYDLQPPVLSYRGLLLFFVEFKIGEPQITQTAGLDTGSSLLWVQGTNCNGCDKESINPFYNSATSSSYTQLSCHDELCDRRIGGVCDMFRKCSFTFRYISGLVVRGFMGTEKLVFEDYNGKMQPVSDIVFGYVTEKIIGSEGEKKVGGVFGLGLGGDVSFITLLGSNFSYCTGFFDTPNYDFNTLLIGKHAILEGAATPFKAYRGQYFVTLLGISVGDKHEVDDIMVNQLSFKRYIKDPTEMCFQVFSLGDLVRVPNITLHFANNANLSIHMLRAFSQTYEYNVFCFNFYSHEDLKTKNDEYFDEDGVNLSIIGMHATQLANVGYDVAGKMIYFNDVECADLWV
ncbi:hypothetical protein ACFE04_023407 [Oxalis oulophora]